MKKIFAFAIFLFAVIGLVGCNKTPGKGGDNGDDKNYDLNGMDINIVSNIATRLDPRSENFERLFRTEKIANVNAVEEKYNVKINYVDYPSTATWGSARDNWIISQSTLGNANFHIFEVSSNSIANLAAQDAILPLNNLIEKYGSKGFWEQKRNVGNILGETYAYDDSFPIGDEGIYYNSDLLEALLGEDRRIEPTELWAKGEWTWDKFRELSLEIKGLMDHNLPEEDGGPQYVLGGRTYDWAYPMVGSNGGTIVNNQFEAKLTSPEFMETLNFLSGLYEVDGMWIDDADITNTVQSEFRRGNVAFHVGQSWFLTIDTKWAGLDFNIDFVPFPVGPRVESGEAEYRLNDVKGQSSFVINSAFSKDNIPEGYEDLMLHDEILFQIWNDLLYFPELKTDGSYDLEIIKDDFYAQRLMAHYASEKSREAHIDIVDKLQSDFFYSVTESQGHIEGSFLLEIQRAIRDNEVRTVMEANQPELQAILNEKIVNRFK